MTFKLEKNSPKNKRRRPGWVMAERSNMIGVIKENTTGGGLPKKTIVVC
jgi:hypothetical protein